MSKSRHDETHPLLLVCRLALHGASGLLSVKTEGKLYTLCMKNGRLIFASTNLKRLQFADWLDAAGLGSATTGSGATDTSGGSRDRVDALVQQGAGTRTEITAHLQQWLRAIILEALGLDHAECEFQEGTPVTRNEITLEDTTRALLLEAAAEAPPDIRTKIQASLKHAATPTRAAAPEPTPAAPRATSWKDEAQDPAAAAPPSTQPRTEASPPSIPQGVASGRPPHDLSSIRDPVLREILEAADTVDSKTLYEILGISRDADENAIRTAYYGMARRCHPDIWRGEETDRYRATVEHLFTAVTEAYNRLRRPADRAAYDEEISAGNRHDTQPRQDPAAMAAENFTQGRHALAAGNLHDAHQFLTNAVRIDPARGEHHRELGIVQMQNPRWQKAAETSLREAVELQPTDARALSHLGFLYKKNGLLRRADDLFNRALQWDPDNALALAERSRTDERDESGGLIKGLFGRG